MALYLCVCACVRALEYGHGILATDNALFSFGFNCGSMRFGVRIRIKRVSEKDFMAFNAIITKYHIVSWGNEINMNFKFYTQVCLCASAHSAPFLSLQLLTVSPCVLIYLLPLSPCHYSRIPNFPPLPPDLFSIPAIPSSITASVSTPVALLSSCDLLLSTTNTHSLFHRHTEIASGRVRVLGGSVTVISARCRPPWG